MENTKLDLLNDISKLLKKYGPEVFYELAIFLKEEKFLNALSELLIKFSEEGKKRNIVSTKSKNVPMIKIRDQLIAIKETDAEKSGILLDFYDKIYSQGVNLNLKEITNFASDIGVNLSKSKSKDDAISKLLIHLMKIPSNELQNHFEHFKYNRTDNDRSLESWSNIILKKENK